MSDAAIRLLVAGLDRLLDADPSMRGRLRALEGHSVGLHLERPRLTLAVTVVDGRLQATAAEAAELSIAASPAALLRQWAGERGLSLPAGRVRISGDADLARQLQRCFAAFAPDLEELACQAFGDVAGVHLVRAGRALRGWLQARAVEFAGSSVAWLRDESAELVGSAEHERFATEVEDFRDAVARAERRLEGLERSRTAAR